MARATKGFTAGFGATSGITNTVEDATAGFGSGGFCSDTRANGVVLLSDFIISSTVRRFFKSKPRDRMLGFLSTGAGVVTTLFGEENESSELWSSETVLRANKLEEETLIFFMFFFRFSSSSSDSELLLEVSFLYDRFFNETLGETTC